MHGIDRGVLCALSLSAGETGRPVSLCLMHSAHCRRMKWRRQQPITVLELRCKRLREPLVLPQDSSYYGCFSWVDLHSQCQEMHAEGEYVIEEEDFEERQAGLRAALQTIEATPVQEL